MVNVSSFFVKQRVCIDCKRRLVPIGTARCGGKKTHGDWSTRLLHKKCFIKRLKAEALAEAESLWQQELATQTPTPTTLQQDNDQTTTVVPV